MIWRSLRSMLQIGWSADCDKDSRTQPYPMHKICPAFILRALSIKTKVTCDICGVNLNIPSPFPHPREASVQDSSPQFQFSLCCSFHICDLLLITLSTQQKGNAGENERDAHDCSDDAFGLATVQPSVPIWVVLTGWFSAVVVVASW